MNYEWDARALLSLVLVGLPDLEHRLALGRNRSLQSRLHTRLRLPAPTAADTAEYLDYRLKRAGAQAHPFREDAITLLHAQTAGIPREIDRLATAALRLAANRGARSVDPALIDELLDAAVRPLGGTTT